MSTETKIRSVETVDKGPVKISPGLRSDITSVVSEMVGHVPADMQLICAVIGQMNKAGENFWKSLPSQHSTLMSFIDERADLSATYCSAQKLDIPIASPLMAAHTEFPSTDEARFCLGVYVRPRYRRDHISAQSIWREPRVRLKASGTVNHEAGHSYSNILIKASANSRGIGEYWHPNFIVPKMLQEGFADMWAPPQPHLVMNKGETLLVSAPFLADAAHLMSLPMETPQTEVLDAYITPTKRNLLENQKLYYETEAKQLGTYISLLGIRAGLPANQLVDLLSSSEHSELTDYCCVDTPLVELYYQLSSVRFPDILVDEAIRMHFEMIEHYFDNYNQFAWAGYYMSNIKEQNDDQRRATLDKANQLNSSLVKELLGDPDLNKLFDYYLQLISELKQSAVFTQWDAPKKFESTQTRPISVFSPPQENPYYELIRHRTLV